MCKIAYKLKKSPRIGYKLVEKRSGKYYSFYARTLIQDGEISPAQKPSDRVVYNSKMRGKITAYESRETALEELAFERLHLLFSRSMYVVAIKVELSGEVFRLKDVITWCGDPKSIAGTHIRILGEVSDG